MNFPIKIPEPMTVYEWEMASNTERNIMKLLDVLERSTIVTQKRSTNDVGSAGGISSNQGKDTIPEQTILEGTSLPQPT